MKLDKVVLNGFKSFADKTEFPIDSGITAIVGPNGCGKSNVVDAVRWVLGEQSAKSLRSGQMADVIFGGSTSRKPLGLSEVSLCFSDVSGTIAADTDELVISRRLYRSGESEYLINNKPCRLRDIRELFMDTGVGVRAYSIIEQGQIDRLLNASREERRGIFEEAAGISKYKAHKKEALRKLERTEQNLLRLADIVGEVQKQLRSVKLQAGKARSYLQYSQQLKELRVNYSLSEFHKLKTDADQKQKTLGQLNEKFAAVVSEVAANDTLISELGSRIIQTENQINQTDNALVSVISRIDQQNERINFLRSHIIELQARRDQTRSFLRELTDQHRRLNNDISQAKTEAVESQQALKDKNAELAAAEETIRTITAECSSINAELEDEKSGIIDIVRRTAQLHNELGSLSEYRSNLSGQKERLFDRAQAAKTELQELLAAKAQHQARLNDIEKVLTELQDSLHLKRDQIAAVSEQLLHNNEALAQAKEARSALTSEFTVLRDMEDRREGLNTAVKRILAERSEQGSKFNCVVGIIADLIHADSTYAAAVEAALCGKTNAMVVNRHTDFLEARSHFAQLQGRVNVICSDQLQPFVDSIDLSQYPSVRGRAVEFVKYDKEYAPLAWKLLGHTILVDNIDSAFALSRQLPAQYSFVTEQGEFLSNDGLVTIGPVGSSTGLISRKSRLAQLQNEITQIEQRIAGQQEQLAGNEQQSRHLEKLYQDLRTAVYEANTEKTTLTSHLSGIEQNIKRLTEEQPLITGEIDLLETQIARSVQKEYESKQQLEELETVNTQRNQRVTELDQRLADRRLQQHNSTELLTNLKVSVGRFTEQLKAATSRISSLESQIADTMRSLKAAQSEIDTSSSQISQKQCEILNCETAVSALYLEKEQTQHDSSLLHRNVQELLENQKNTEQLLRTLRGEQSRIEQQIHEVKIELSNIDVKKTDLTQRVGEELQIDLIKAYETYSEQNLDWDSIRQEITDLRAKIDRLGSVNVSAIDEQQELEKRNEFLTSQVQDLNSSKAQLQQLINRLNKQSKERFVETFETVRINFQEIFRKLFGGGKADVMLEDPENVLECGIEIIGRPPGKEPRSLSLLSGGEKALTALALLFAVFKSKPSPFCFLDEADAALDEANNERFNLIIREFQQHSQFIIITHSKRTMSIADVLFGVTMQQQGVSKKISVKFDRYEEPAVA
ncbi:MAG: chromosome segregation protein SMC [Planctomycetota bacterium]